MALIICSDCGKEISDKATTCPNCGCPISTSQTNAQPKQDNVHYARPAGNLLKQEKPKKKRTGLWVVIGIIVLFVGCGSCLGGSETGDSTTVIDNSIEEETDKETAEEVKEMEPVEVESVVVEEVVEENFVKVGGSFEVNGLKIIVNEADLEFTDFDNPYGIHDLEEGLRYVMVSFTCENNDDSDKYVSIYDYDCYADGTLCEQKYGFDEDFMNANISSGRNVSYKTYYEVPVDAAEIELEYTANVWTSEKVIIKLQ